MSWDYLWLSTIHKKEKTTLLLKSTRNQYFFRVLIIIHLLLLGVQALGAGTFFMFFSLKQMVYAKLQVIENKTWSISITPSWIGPLEKRLGTYVKNFYHLFQFIPWLEASKQAFRTEIVRGLWSNPSNVQISGSKCPEKSRRRTFLLVLIRNNRVEYCSFIWCRTSKRNQEGQIIDLRNSIHKISRFHLHHRFESRIYKSARSERSQSVCSLEFLFTVLIVILLVPLVFIRCDRGLLWNRINRKDQS